MLKINTKVTNWVAIAAFCTAIAILAINLQKANAEKEKLEKDNGELDSQIVDLEDEKNSLVEEISTKNKKIKKAEKQTEKEKATKKKLEKNFQEESKKVKKLERDLSAKLEKKEREKENNKNKVKSDETTAADNDKGTVEGGGDVINANATHYSAFCPTGCTGVTATGEDVSNSIYVDGKRVVAVDPNQIPLGSTVRVTGGGYDFEALALDTGGDIGHGRIDILVESTEEAYNLGRADVQVEVLN